MIMYPLALLFTFFFNFSFLYAQSDEVLVEKGEANTAKNELAREAESFSDFFRTQSKNAFKGVVFGNVILAKEDYIYVKPKEGGLGRMYVYIDSETSYSKMQNGKRDKSKKDDIIEGQRVAVRVLMKEGLILADEIFIVEGEFGPRSRYRKKVSYKKKPKDGKESEKDKAAGHGAKKEEAEEEEEESSKKPPKKSGGH